MVFAVGDVRPSRRGLLSLRSGVASLRVPVPVTRAEPVGTSASTVVSPEDASLDSWGSASRNRDGMSQNRSGFVSCDVLSSDHSGSSTPVESAAFTSPAARGLMWGLLYASRAEPVTCSWEELRETSEAAKLAVPPMMTATLAAQASFNPAPASANLDPREAVFAADSMGLNEIVGECGLGAAPTKGDGDVAPLASARATAIAVPADAAASTPAVFKTGTPPVVASWVKMVSFGLPLSTE